MILNLEKFDPETGRQIVFSASDLHDLKICKRYFQYRSILGWRHPPGTGASLTFGKATHAALEEYDRQVATGTVHTIAQREAIIAGLKASEGLELSDDNKKTIETLTRLVVWYTEQFKQDEYQTVILPTGEAALEVRFEVPIPSTSYWLSGYIDKLVKSQGELYVLERKTTSATLGDYYFDRYSPNTQVSAYVWALRQMGFEVKGAVIDATQTAVNFTRIARRTIHRTPEQLDEWLRDTLWHINEGEKCYDEQYWPQNDAACALYGGCPYRSVCGRPPNIRGAFLEADFVQRKDKRDETLHSTKLLQEHVPADDDPLR